MATFKGTYNYSIDHKGRISLPVKLRDKSDSPTRDLYTVVRGFEGCIAIYPVDAWKKIEEKVAELKTLRDPNARFFERVLFPNAEDAKLDGMGRLMIPQHLLTMACIKKDVVIRGVNDRIELWDPEMLQNYLQSQPESYEDVAGKIF